MAYMPHTEVFQTMSRIWQQLWEDHCLWEHLAGLKKVVMGSDLSLRQRTLECELGSHQNWGEKMTGSERRHSVESPGMQV